LRALKDMGDRYVTIVPKITDRNPKATDGEEIISINNRSGAQRKSEKDFDKKYDIIYENYGNHYGISSSEIFENLKHGKFQILIVSNSQAIQKLYEKFEPIIKLIYLYSPVNEVQLEKHQLNIAMDNEEEIKKRKDGINSIH